MCLKTPKTELLEEEKQIQVTINNYIDEFKDKNSYRRWRKRHNGYECIRYLCIIWRRHGLHDKP